MQKAEGEQNIFPFTSNNFIKFIFTYFVYIYIYIYYVEILFCRKSFISYVQLYKGIISDCIL